MFILRLPPVAKAHSTHVYGICIRTRCIKLFGQTTEICGKRCSPTSKGGPKAKASGPEVIERRDTPTGLSRS